MGIDTEQWRARIGTYNGGRRCRTPSGSYQRLPVSHAVTWTTRDIIQTTPLPVQAGIALVSLWMVLCSLHCLWKKIESSQSTKIVQGCSFYRKKDTMFITVCVSLLAAATVIFHSLAFLLIMAGDVELNPGPEMDTVLSIEDLFDVWNKLFNARTKWYAIGLNLNVDDETLRSIELQPSTDCGKCLSNMLAHRLRSGGPLTWKDLCNSLRSQTVGRSDVAEEIEKWLIKDHKGRKRSPSELPSDLQPPTRSHKALASEDFPRVVDLQKETWNPVEESFAELTVSIKESLESRSVEPREIVSSLVAAYYVPQILDSGIDNSGTIFFEVKQKCEQSQTFSEVWSVVLNFITFYSFKLLKTIVNSKHGTKDDQQKLQEYENKFLTYSKTVIDKYDGEFFRKNSDGLTEMILKVKKKFKKVSEEHLDEFKCNLALAIGVLSEHLHLIKLKPGCTVLTYEALLIVEVAAFPLSDEQKVMLKKLEVIWLRCGKYKITLDEKNVIVADDSHSDANDPDYQSHIKFEQSLNHNLPTETGNNLQNPDNHCAIESASSDGKHHTAENYDNNQSLQTNSEILNSAVTVAAAAAKGLDIYSDSGLGSSLKSSKPHMVASATPFCDAGSEITTSELIDNDKSFIWKEMSTISSQPDILHGLEEYANKQFSTMRVEQWTSETSVHIPFQSATHVYKLVEDKREMLAQLFKDNSNNTILHSAASNGSLLKVKACTQLLRCNPLDINRQGNTALHVAAEYGHLDIVRYLIEECQTSPLTKSENGSLPIHFAAKCGHQNLVEYLITECQKIDYDHSFIMSTDIDGNNIFHFAVASQNLELVKYIDLYSSDSSARLLESGNKYGSLPIHKACQEDCNDIVQYLIQRDPSSVLSRDYSRLSLLHYAALSDTSGVLKYLIKFLEKRCDLIGLDKFHNTILHFAAISGCLESVQFLIKHCGFDPNLHNIEGLSPFFLACQFGEMSVIKYFIEDCNCERSTKALGKAASCLYGALSGRYDVFSFLLNYESDLIDTDATARSVLLGVTIGDTSVDNCNIALFINKFGQTFDLNLNSFSEDTPLVLACIFDNVNAVRYFLEECEYDVCATDNKGWSPLHYAAVVGAFNVVELLVSRYQFNPIIKDKSGMTPMHLAAISGEKKLQNVLPKIFYDFLLQSESVGSLTNEAQEDLETHLKCLIDSLSLKEATYFPVIQYLSEFNANPLDNEKRTPLHLACRHGHLNLVKFLIEETNCDKSLRDEYGINALGCAILSGHLGTIEYLVVEQMFDPNFAVSDEILSLPHLVLASGKATDILKLLIDNLKRGLSTYPIKNGRNMLHSACVKGEIVCVQYLLDKGYDINAKDGGGRTPLYIAASAGHFNLVTFLASREECDIMCTDVQGITPVDAAGWHGHIAVLKYFCEELHCNPGHTLIHAASKNGHIEIVIYLVEVCAVDVNFQEEKFNLTPLHIAALNGCQDITEYLTSRQDCILAPKGRNDCTPIHFAAEYGYLEVLKTFKQKLECSINDFIMVSGEMPIHLAVSHIAVLKYFVEECSVDVNTVNKDLDRSVLHYASIKGQTTAVEYLIEKGCKILSKDIYGYTPPHLAIINDQPEIAKYFVTKLNYNPISDINYSGRSPIHSCCISGSIGLVKYLVEECECDIYMRDETGQIPLVYAVTHGRWNIVAYLVSGNDLQMSLDDKFFWIGKVSQMLGFSPLHLICKGGQEDMAGDIVQDDPLFVKRTDEVGQTPLFFAVINGHLNIVRLLINNEYCDPMHEDLSGSTPLHYAAIYGRAEILKCLINEAKCDPKCMNNFGNLSHCASLKPTETNVRTELGKLNIILFLIENYEGLLTKNRFGDTFLHIAARNGYLKIVKHLVSNYKWCLQLSNRFGLTIADIAPLFDNQEVVEFLQQHTTSTHSPPSVIHLSALLGHISSIQHYITDLQYDPDLRDSIGRTPLHYAAMRGHLIIIQYLVSSNADPLSEDVFHNLPLHYAAALGHLDVVQFLVNIGSPLTARGVWDKTPAEMAAAGGHKNVLDYLDSLQDDDGLDWMF